MPRGFGIRDIDLAVFLLGLCHSPSTRLLKGLGELIKQDGKIFHSLLTAVSLLAAALTAHEQLCCGKAPGSRFASLSGLKVNIRHVSCSLINSLV